MSVVRALDVEVVLHVNNLVVHRVELLESVILEVLKLLRLEVRRHLERLHALLQTLAEGVRLAGGELRLCLLDLLVLLPDHPTLPSVILLQTSEFRRQSRHLLRVHATLAAPAPEPTARRHPVPRRLGLEHGDARLESFDLLDGAHEQRAVDAILRVANLLNLLRGSFLEAEHATQTRVLSENRLAVLGVVRDDLGQSLVLEELDALEGLYGNLHVRGLHREVGVHGHPLGGILRRLERRHRLRGFVREGTHLVQGVVSYSPERALHVGHLRGEGEAVQGVFHKLVCGLVLVPVKTLRHEIQLAAHASRHSVGVGPQRCRGGARSRGDEAAWTRRKRGQRPGGGSSRGRRAARRDKRDEPRVKARSTERQTGGLGTHPSPFDAEGACDLMFCAFAFEYLSSSSSYPRRCIATVGRTKHTRRPAR